MSINSSILNRSFYSRDTAMVARDLLGKTLICQIDGITLTGTISEVEAYYGENDSASHASRGLTPRTSVMFGLAGFSYVYFIYGTHNMLNVVTELEGVAGAVLIRSLIPGAAEEIMIKNRNGNRCNIANGPARICQALGISREQNSIDLTAGEELWIEDHDSVPSDCMVASPRIGINYANQKDREALLRFQIKR